MSARQQLPDGMWWLWMPIHRRAHHAPICWIVLWVTGDSADAIGSCDHRHATREDALACPWEPDPLPPIGAGVVTWTRDPEYRTVGEVMAEARRAAQPRQLELALEAG